MEVLDKLLEAGFDPAYGARPLKRVIQQLIENPLAQSILCGAICTGGRDKRAGIKGQLQEGLVVFG